ncbi:polysaccharide lyase 6 family protein [Algoriphagus aestuarii]|nr:polysaccharide lyase 6 family protein [Algoriphagus aestuarii]
MITRKYIVQLICCLTLGFFLAQESKASVTLVQNMDQYKTATKSLIPGDTIMLANGIWKDAELILQGNGTLEKPIVLIAETPGEVFLEGKSNLSIGGNYLIVKGLVFRNGFTPSSEVISFRIDSENLAFHSRVTECVIDDYNNPDRNAQDTWIMMYGRNNRFDHNHIEGKRNVGVTMAVRLNSEQSQENYHSIDHNYFGPRPVLGSNGGETLRIGTSTYSLTNSYTEISNNYFDKCNGETEIISIKSGKNVIKGNVFLESKGSLTLRHGNGNIIEKNIFLGNGVAETGGIRVINAEHQIKDNYMQDLSGEDFRAGITIMNGVPNSPINRYHQVKNVTISNNSLINVASVELAVGSDGERSARPENITLEKNLIISENAADIFKTYDKIDGIHFVDNQSNFQSTLIDKGLETTEIKLEKGSNGLLYPTDLSIQAGAPRDLRVLSIDETGTNWYVKKSKEIVFDVGKKIKVSPGLNQISDALSGAQTGDILELEPGMYEQTKVLDITFPVSIVAGQDARISFEGNSLFEIYNGGALSVTGVKVTGKNAADAAGNAVIKINRSGTLRNYKLKIEKSEFTDMSVNHSFNFLEASSGSFADTIEISNTNFKNFTGSILALNKEKEDLGKYNAEYILLTENRFESIGGVIADIYRGGTDESTFGPYVLVQNNQIIDAGNNSRNKTDSSFYLYGTQWLVLTGNSFLNSAPVKVIEMVGTPYSLFEKNQFDQTKQIIHSKNQVIK